MWTRKTTDIDDPRLFPYQREGIRAITDILLQTGSGRAALLADPPGAGKTSQVITVMDEIQGLKSKTFLIICPASLRLNWVREIELWTSWRVSEGNIGVIRSHKDIEEAKRKKIVICSYSLATKGDVSEALTERHWGMLILDEAHAVKNPASLNARVILVLLWARCQYRVLITGTPIPNGRASEAWSMFSRLAPDLFGLWKPFAERYCIKEETRYGVTYPRSKNLEELGRIARERFMIRRSREEIMGQLPELVRCTIPLDVPELAVIEAEDGIDIEALIASIENGVPLRSDPIATARRKLGVLKARPAVLYLTTVLLEEVENVVVFCHHREVFAYLFEQLQVYGISVVCINGTTSVDDRQKAVDDFQAKTARVFLGSITAANSGITLTASSTVVFVEFEWVPSINEQAEGRINRVGQKDLMRAIYLTVPNSLDEAILRGVMRKQKSIQKVMLEGANRVN